ncbi:RimJ/RimL family protein N-acetyltransferase [Arthrobacter pascens]|uniref:GNAT family N-acetyltransferase n=1 Tax=Arthrobacter pascens TaxID=1677 RepID=UPI00278E6BEC|nr:GNAT family protein [Arthrobacter pascens]MDQ0677240.1 RimJ/RimL family protein N-acetyltransferase [Arthrobacter pascens]
MPDITLPIRTERLILRRFEGRDLDAFHGYHSMPETARFLPGPAKTYTQSMERVGKYANFVFEKEGDWVCLAIEAKGSAGLLGEMVLKWLPGRGQGEAGWTLAPGARGKGYATEAAEGVLKLGFEELGFHRIEARLDELNTASAVLCERLGMRLEARLVDKWHYKGQWATELVYSILEKEWRTRG